MPKYSITKSPDATFVVALTKDEALGTPIEATKTPGNTTVSFSKASSTFARLVKQGGSSFELYPQDNAASILTEVDATTGWSASNCTFTSDAASPDDGLYALKGLFTGNGGRFVFDLDTILTAGTAYSWSAMIRHTGAGGDIKGSFAAIVSGGPNGATILTNTDTTYQAWNYSFTYDAAQHRYVSVRENSGTNDGGAFLDTISIVPT